MKDRSEFWMIFIEKGKSQAKHRETEKEQSERHLFPGALKAPSVKRSGSMNLAEYLVEGNSSSRAEARKLASIRQNQWLLRGARWRLHE